MDGTRRGCLFCGSTTNKMSAEHLFRETYRDRIPHAPFTERTRYRPGSSGEEQFTRIPRGIFDHKVNGVCRSCNSSWMNALDEAVEDVVVALGTRSATTIDARDAAPLAGWATKTALLRAWVDKSFGWEPDPNLFKVLYETRQPPPGTVVRVGVADEMVKQGGSNSCRALSLVVEHVRLPGGHQDHGRYTLNAVSWGLGYMYVHVILHSPFVLPLAQLASKRVGQALGPAAPVIYPGAARSVELTSYVTGETAARAGNLAHLLDGEPLHPSD